MRSAERRWGGGAPSDCGQSGDLSDKGFDGERNGPCGRNRRPVAEEQCCRMAGASRGVIPEGCAIGRRACQDTEHDHGAAAGWAAIGPARRDGILDLFGGRFLRWRVEQPATERELGGALAVREEAEVADAMEAVRQGVQKEAADELIGRKRHELGLAVMAIILPAEGRRGIGQADQARVCDCDAVCVSAEIGQHLSRPAEGRLGIDYPLDPSQVAEASGEGGRSRERRKLAEEAKFASRKGGTQFLEKQAAEEPREDAHRQEEPPATGDPARVIERGTAAGHEAMNVRMMVQVLAPVWSTATSPISAPRCFGSAAIVRSVSAAVRNRMA